MSTIQPKTISNEFQNVVKVIGDAYILNIIAMLSQKQMRFSELERTVPDICPATLTDRLKKLEQEHIVIKEKETVDKVSVVYNLTSKGMAMIPIIHAINVYAEKV